MKPNIIFVLLDGARWDRNNKSQEFKELCKEGTLLNNVVTAMPYTMGSINVIFSGFYGKENGVSGYNKITGLKKSIKTLQERLKSNGYFTSYYLIHKKIITERGFDVHKVFDEFHDNGEKNHPDFLKGIFERAGRKPTFTFLQYSEIHTMTTKNVLRRYKWNDKKFYSQKRTNFKRYDSALSDAWGYAKKIKKIVENMKLKNDTIFIFFSDHGMALGEHFGERSYGAFTYEETVRTFYLFVGPKIQKNKSFHSQRSTIDILPTILDICNIKSKRGLPGKSMARTLFGKEDKLVERKMTFSETGSLHGPFPSPEKSNVFCVRTSQYKLIYFKTPNQWYLFDLCQDPCEKNNLIGKLPIENKLRKSLLRWINREKNNFDYDIYK